ncbi:L-2-amino-thiazoline-4-carboxylic acid hydrolase [Candidatus Bathyarchaeota archaeon]|nr:L-2-amino-thiazoline-4-carboxylic acid hydrolase [Candidatus Bathyarchaeota archaeon]
MAIHENPRWNDKFEITYLELVKNQFKGEIALAQELYRVLGEEKAREVLNQLYLGYLVDWARGFLQNHRIESMEDFIAVKQKLGSPRSHIIEVTEVTPTSYKEKYSSCIYAKVFRDLGVPEIGFCMFCSNDFMITKLLNPKLNLERTKTLMQGDEYCDFNHTWTDN